MATSTDKLITNKSIEEYFRGLIGDALGNQRVEANDTTVYYVVNVLTTFSRAEALYERTEDGMTIKPLASMYAEALESRSERERNMVLRRLGDVALFIAGVFSRSLNRKVVDVDYYISMGGGAYGYLSDTMRNSSSGAALGGVFEELSQKFHDFVDVLADVSSRTGTNRDTDILRIYEIWVRTGSKRAARQLRGLGIEPNAFSTSLVKH